MGPKMYTFFDRILAAVNSDPTLNNPGQKKFNPGPVSNNAGWDVFSVTANSGQDYFLKSGQGNYEIGGRYTYASLISLSANLGNTNAAS